MLGIHHTTSHRQGTTNNNVLCKRLLELLIEFVVCSAYKHDALEVTFLVKEEAKITHTNTHGLLGVFEKVYTLLTPENQPTTVHLIQQGHDHSQT